MSYSDYALIKKSTLTDIGDAIRAQKGTSDLIDPADFSSEIESIESGGNLDYLVQPTMDDSGIVQYKDGYNTRYFLSESKTYNFYDSNKNKIGIGYSGDYGLAYLTTPVDLTDVDRIWFGGWVGTNSDRKLTISVTAGVTSDIPSSAIVNYDEQQTIDIYAMADAGKTDSVRKEGSHYGLCLDVSGITGEKYIVWSMTHGTETPEYSAYLWLDTIALDAPNEGGVVSVVEGHAEVDSIITDGACYINTNICPNPNYSIEMKCRLHTIVDDRFDFFFGTRNGTYARWQARFDVLEDSTAPNQLRVQRSTANDVAGSWYTSSQTKQDWMNTFRVLKLAKNKVYIDGALQYTFDSTSTKEHYLYPVYLFSCNDKYSEAAVLSGYGHLECEYAKMWNEDDELILDLVPVVKNDGTVCMYNKVNGAYYYNEGTGEFTYSGEPKQDIVMYELQEKTVSENGEVTPDEGYYGLSKVTVDIPTDATTGTVTGHTEVESLITDGSSYINTNICPNPNYSIEMKFKMSQMVEDNWDFLFGCKFENRSGVAARFDTGESGLLAVKRSHTYLTDREWWTSNLTRNDFNTCRTFKIAKNEVYLDDALIHTFTATTEANEQHYVYPLYLFTVNDSNTTYANNSGYLDVKYVKLWDDKDNLVLDLIPVIKHDNTICMYNKVNGAYYYNSGTGSFSAKVNFVIGNKLYLRSEGGVKIPTGCTTSGNYIDCEGQEWLYNTVDLTTNTKTQYVSSMVLDGSEAWGNNTTTIDDNTYYDFYSVNPHDVQNRITIVGTNLIGPIYIEGFRVWSQNNINSKYYTEDRLRTGFVNATAVLYNGGSGNAYLNMIDRDCMNMTVDEWKAHLAAHPKTLYYVLRTAVISTLSDEEVALLIDPTASPEPEEPSTPEVVSDALIDIDMMNGINKGTGGSTYDAVNNNGTFTDGKFVLDTPGCLTVPTEFMAESSTEPWTVAFTMDNYTIGDGYYSRVARGNNDVPTVFFHNRESTITYGFNHKLVSKASYSTDVADRLCGTSWYDQDFYWTNTGGGLVFTTDFGTKTTFVFRHDSVNTELWINGVKRCVADSSLYTSEFWASTFSIGNDQYNNADTAIAGRNMNHLECSMLKLWDRAITDDEIALLCTPTTVEEAMYEYYGIDKEEYPYLYIASWYNSSKNWRIKPIFAKSINDETGVITDVLGLQEATTKSLTDDEYNNTSYYSNINTIFDYMKQSSITFNNSYDSYQTDNILDKCWYFTNWNATYYTNWADLRTLYI